MTTIVYRNGILAADTRSTRNDTIEPSESNKVFRLKDGRLFAWCGKSGIGIRVREWFNNPRLSLPSYEDTEGGAVIVATNGELFTFECGALVPAAKAPYLAMGSGRHEAYGALAMGASARKAVSVAMQFDTSTGGRVTWLRL